MRMRMGAGERMKKEKGVRNERADEDAGRVKETD